MLKARSLLTGFLLLSLLWLTGCVRYEVGVNFASPDRGTLTQEIRLSDQFMALSPGVAQDWLADLERQARSLQGRTRHLSPQEIQVTIPFLTGADLERRFNRFFQLGRRRDDRSPSQEPTLPPITSHLTVKQVNWLLGMRNHLIFDLDLRPLAVIAAQGQQFLNAGSLLDLQFGVQAPWGVKSIEGVGQTGTVVAGAGGRSLHWTLTPGQQNHWEVIFWLPNPLGIGAVLIGSFVGWGFRLKYPPRAKAAPLPGATVTNPPTTN